MRDKEVAQVGSEGLREMGRFPHYPGSFAKHVTGDDLRAVTERAKTPLAELDGIFDQLSVQHKYALLGVAGQIAPGLAALRRGTGDLYEGAVQSVILGIGAAESFSGDIDVFNDGVDDLNARDEAEQRRPETSHVISRGSALDGEQTDALDGEYQRLWADLDARAAEVGRVLEAGITSETVEWLLRHGAVPAGQLDVFLTDPDICVDGEDVIAWFHDRLDDGAIDHLQDVPECLDRYAPLLMTDRRIQRSMREWLHVDGERGENDGDNFRPVQDRNALRWDNTRRRVTYLVASAAATQPTAPDPDSALELTDDQLDYLENFYGKAIGDVDTLDVYLNDDQLHDTNRVLMRHDESFRSAFADGLIALGDEERTGGEYDRLPEAVQFAPIYGTAESLREMLEPSNLFINDQTLGPYLPR